jgi:predicted dehydrogenase
MIVGAGLVGYGYWGPNIARNFSAAPGCQLRAICELDPERRALASRVYPGARVTADYAELLADETIQLILVTTPVWTHYELARAALDAGKDLLVAKPLTRTAAEAEELVAMAAARNCVLAVDHTFLFTGAVRKMQSLVSSGELGEILYIDSVRVNLGLFQSDINVVWDLGPHDLSILLYLLDRDPTFVTAMGACHGGDSLESLAYLHLEFDDRLVAHYHLSWLAPVKIRQTLIGGSKKMIVYNEMEPSEKVKVYEKGIDVTVIGDKVQQYQMKVDYRTGDMIAPKLVHREALAVEAEHVIQAVKTRQRPLSDGAFAARVVRILEAAQVSLEAGGARVPVVRL